jgi:hypothetical protein
MVEEFNEFEDCFSPAGFAMTKSISTIRLNEPTRIDSSKK